MQPAKHGRPNDLSDSLDAPTDGRVACLRAMLSNASWVRSLTARWSRLRRRASWGIPRSSLGR